LFIFYLFGFVIIIVVHFNNKILATSLNNCTSGDLDALITVEILFVTPEKDDEKLQIANIQFNNLDIIGKYKSIFLYLIN